MRALGVLGPTLLPSSPASLRPAAGESPHRRALALTALEAPVPVLLVLGPRMAGWPWSLAIARAACTLQLAELVPSVSVTETVEHAVVACGVDTVVVAGEGRGRRPSGASLRSLRSGLSTIEASLGPFGADVTLAAVWHDVETGETASSIDRLGRWRRGAEETDVLRALLRPAPLASSV